MVACGALVRELRTVLGQLPDGGARFDVVYLPANLHNRPERIPAAVEQAVADAAPHDRVFIAYADCGTGGLLDPVVTRLGATRLPGAHCYGFFAGASNFDALVVQGLGLDRHPELRDQYFVHYTRVVLLSQSEDPELRTLGRAAAERLGLAFEHVHVGLDPFTVAVRVAVA